MEYPLKEERLRVPSMFQSNEGDQLPISQGLEEKEQTKVETDVPHHKQAETSLKLD